MEKKSELPQILGLVALIVVLVIGVKVLFSSLSVINSHQQIDAAQSVSVSATAAESGSSAADAAEQGGEEAPSFCPYCGKQLPSTFQWEQYCPYCGEQILA